MIYHNHNNYGTKLDPAPLAQFIKLGDVACVEINDEPGTVYIGAVILIDNTHIQVEDMPVPIAFADMIGAWRYEEDEGYLFKTA